MSDCLRKVDHLLGIKQKVTTACHQMCNGLVDKFNATLKTCRRHLCSEQSQQWDRYINPVLFTYREVPQESTWPLSSCSMRESSWTHVYLEEILVEGYQEPALWIREGTARRHLADCSRVITENPNGAEALS
ncbi:Zinc finger protein [Plakobranchus ocellatus]|uniref:Zinc finger protein n=1 Tax=Plakobranchus ocellatus TaxID=259542 RepID=A0AAV4DK62_9GAST|nr:Zinc finger protein [Plakobranchus ocellatus]